METGFKGKGRSLLATDLDPERGSHTLQVAALAAALGSEVVVLHPVAVPAGESGRHVLASAEQACAVTRTRLRSAGAKSSSISVLRFEDPTRLILDSVDELDCVLVALVGGLCLNSVVNDVVSECSTALYLPGGAFETPRHVLVVAERCDGLEHVPGSLALSRALGAESTVLTVDPVPAEAEGWGAANLLPCEAPLATLGARALECEADIVVLNLRGLPVRSRISRLQSATRELGGRSATLALGERPIGRHGI